MYNLTHIIQEPDLFAYPLGWVSPSSVQQQWRDDEDEETDDWDSDVEDQSTIDPTGWQHNSEHLVISINYTASLNIYQRMTWFCNSS